MDNSEINELTKGVVKILSIADKKQPEENIINAVSIYIKNVGRHDQKTKEMLLNESIKQVDMYRRKKNFKPSYNDTFIPPVINKIFIPLTNTTTTYKTRKCIYFQDGFCRNEDKCNFAHDDTELIRKPCRYGDQCRNKNNCYFFHS